MRLKKATTALVYRLQSFIHSLNHSRTHARHSLTLAEPFVHPPCLTHSLILPQLIFSHVPLLLDGFAHWPSCWFTHTHTQTHTIHPIAPSFAKWKTVTRSFIFWCTPSLSHSVNQSVSHSGTKSFIHALDYPRIQWVMDSSTHPLAHSRASSFGLRRPEARAIQCQQHGHIDKRVTRDGLILKGLDWNRGQKLLKCISMACGSMMQQVDFTCHMEQCKDSMHGNRSILRAKTTSICTRLKYLMIACQTWFSLEVVIAPFTRNNSVHLRSFFGNLLKQLWHFHQA